MNGEYIKSMDFDRFYEMAEPYIRRVIKKDLDLKKIAAMVKTRIEVFPDIEGILISLKLFLSMTQLCILIRR